MALVHDMAEAVVGDITPFEGVSKEEKHRREDDAMKQICKHLDGSPKLAEEILSLFQEYETGESPESVLMHQIDKFEMLLQASEYEQAQSLDLQQFFDWGENKVSHPVLAKWVEVIQHQRETRKAQRGQQ